MQLERFMVVVLAVTSIAIAVFDFLGAIGQFGWFLNKVPAITLALFSILALYLVGERSTQSRDIRELSAKLEAGIFAETFHNADEAFERLSELIRHARRSIDQIAIAPTPYLGERITRLYRDAQLAVLEKNEITYRCVVDPVVVPRWNVVLGYSRNSTVRKFFLRCLGDDEKVTPALNFFVFDDEALFVRYPHVEGQPEVYIAMRHADTVSLFVAYYRRIWDRARAFTVIERNGTEVVEYEAGKPIPLLRRWFGARHSATL